MFAALAPRYDLANDFISLGLHRLARRRLVELTLAAMPRGGRVLDLACGSGDLALRLARRKAVEIELVGADFSPEMLEVARARAARSGLTKVTFVQADALALPFPANHFDAAVMGFGIRNVDDPSACLLELARVLRPGAQLSILEAGAPPNPFVRALYRAGGTVLLPLLGGLATGRPRDYAYLHRTSLAFPSGAAFIGLLGATGMFESARSEAHLCGALWIYTAKRTMKSGS